MPSTLNQTYDQIKATHGAPGIQVASPVTPMQRTVANLTYNSSNPKLLAYRSQVTSECDKLKEACYKHLLLDIYVKVIPFDQGYADNNRGIFSGDINRALADRNMTATQYFQSAYKETKAPLLEHVIRYVDSVSSRFFEDAMEKRAEDSESGVDTPPPETDELATDSQLVDIQADDEYENFIDKLKRKTVSKIVSDISELIADKKEERDITFSPDTDQGSVEEELGMEAPPEEEGEELAMEAGKSESDTDEKKTKKETVHWHGKEFLLKSKKPVQESAFTVAFDYVAEQVAKAGVELTYHEGVLDPINDKLYPKTVAKPITTVESVALDDLIALAIRESTLNAIDSVFLQPGWKLEHFRTKVRLGKGIVINENTIMSLVGSTKAS